MAYKIRAGQKEFEKGIDLHRITAQITRRQYGKTTGASRIALKKMMRTPGHTVVFGSVKLDLGREIVRKEAEQIRRAIMEFSAKFSKDDKLIDLVDANKGKSIAKISADDFAEVYEAQRLEFRLYHSKTVYSRTKVLALTPEAVGETGDLILDEVGRVKKFREVWEAVKPIISSNPQFRCILTTTPPPDDAHYSFELLAPPIDFSPAPNPIGNWYKTDLGVWVLRITADDAYEDGIPLYDDDTGEAITPAESRRRDHDKDAWDRNYGCKFVIGGSSAIGIVELDTAQKRGLGKCACFQIGEDSDLDVALKFLSEHLGSGTVAVGVDWAASQKEGNNPTAVTVTEADGVDEIQRLVLTWKISNPDIQIERLERVVRTINSRPHGGHCRRVGQDATGQQLFCRTVASALSHLCPVESIVMSETLELPSYDTPVTKKTYYGDLYVAKFDDNRLLAPPERYYRIDHRLPKKIKGVYQCEPTPEGMHGDTFDSGKIASQMLRSSSGALTPELLKQIRLGGNKTRMPQFLPRRLV